MVHDAHASRACPDCPATRNGVFGSLVHPCQGCGFRTLPLASRQAIPPTWFGMGVALVRRGVIVRQRIGPSGGATAVDAAGPGCIVPLMPGGEVGSSAYATADAIVCFLGEEALARAVDGTSSLLRLQAQALERMERIADARGRASAAARVGALLNALADTLAPPRTLAVVPANLQQRDLGALVAMRHESVCRVLVRLEAQGFIARGAEGISLLDRARLATL